MDATFHDETWSLFYGVLIEHELTVGTTPWAGDYPASRPLQGSTNMHALSGLRILNSIA
jgi:hypothetical protein